MSKPLQECLLIIESAERDINNLMLGTDFVHQRLEVNQLFKRLKTKFKFMGAVLEPSEEEKAKKKKFPPITNFMGEKIELGKKITKADLNPKEAELQKLREKVKALYDQIRDLQPAQVLNAYILPEDHIVVRGVAKQAGVDDYQTREINKEFIEDIQVAIEEREEEAAVVSKADENIKEPTTSVLTKEDIDKDPELQKWKAKAGDELIVSPDGKRSVKKQKA